MAVRHGYTLLPFASVGLEDAVSVAFTLDVGWLVRRLLRDRGRLRIPLLYPYNSLQRQVNADRKAGSLSFGWEVKSRGFRLKVSPV